MRVLFWSYGPRGDVEPLVALAARMHELGAQARMCAPADFVARLAETGVPLALAGRSVFETAGGLGGPPEPAHVAAEIAEQFAVLPAAARGCDAVVACGLLSGAVAVRSVAERLGIPYFYALASPLLLVPAAQREQYNRGADAMFGCPLDQQRAAIGLPPVRDLFDYCRTDQPWLAADPVLASAPDDAVVLQTGAWILPDERPLPAELEAFLQAGPPPVYVGFGSGPAPAGVAGAAVEAIRAHGLRTILAPGWAGLALPDDRADCLAVGEVNQQVLFSRVAAVVHHGGAGTTHVATRAGVPQVVVPQIADQPYFAGRVAGLGIGTAHEGPAATPASLSAALATALSPQTRARAAAVAASIRSDGTTVAARALFDAVARASV